MKIAFTTNASDDKIVYFGLLKMMASFYKYHPDIPLFVFTNKDISKEIKKYPKMSWYYLNPVMCKKVAEKYDLVVHLDSDCIVTDRLTEVLEADYDVALVRNNSDQLTAGCGDPCTASGQIQVLKYANCGLVASTRKDFWDDWIENNMLNYNKFVQHEQDVMNLMLKNNDKYKVKLLDSIEKPLYYGIANAYGTKTNWDSWKEIVLKDEKLYLNDKLIKVLHHAGGFVPEKLNIEELFSQEVSEHLKKVCNVF